MAVSEKPARFARRRQIRESRDPLREAGSPPVEGGEIGEITMEGPVFVESEVQASPEVEMERPPGPAVVWQRVRELERKVEVLWLKNVNEIRLAGRSSLVSWRCKGNPDQPKEGCDFVMESTPQGQAKVPPLICPRHGKVPFEILEA